MSKSRKRGLQTWRKRNTYNRKKRKFMKRNPLPVVSLGEMLKQIYPSDLTIPMAQKYPWS